MGNTASSPSQYSIWSCWFTCHNFASGSCVVISCMLFSLIVLGDYHSVQYLSTHWTSSDPTVSHVSQSESPVTSRAVRHMNNAYFMSGLYLYTLWTYRFYLLCCVTATNTYIMYTSDFQERGGAMHRLLQHSKHDIILRVASLCNNLLTSLKIHFTLCANDLLSKWMLIG